MPLAIRSPIDLVVIFIESNAAMCACETMRMELFLAIRGEILAFDATIAFAT
jgi:hypothetical protein